MVRYEWDCEEGSVKIKTTELTGAALDWAVAKIEAPDLTAEAFRLFNVEGPAGLYSWSTDWSQGGPIIEREGIGLFFDRACGNRWRATHRFASYHLHESALVAAMRCYVALKLGDEVEIPEELLR